MKKFILSILCFFIISCVRQTQVEHSKVKIDEFVSDSCSLSKSINETQNNISEYNLIEDGNYKFLTNRNIDRMNIANLPDKVIIMFLSTDSTNLVEYEGYSSITDSIMTTQYVKCNKATAVIINKLNNEYKQLNFTRDFLFKHLSDSLINHYDITYIGLNSSRGDSITFSIASFIFDTDLGYEFIYHYPEKTDTIEWEDVSLAY